MFQPASCGIECTFGSEGADVHLVDDLAFDADAAPLRVGPLKCIRCDNLRRTMHALGLEARARVWPRTFAVDSVFVEAGGTARRAGKITTILAGQCQRLAAVPEDHLHAARFRRP